jgi:hypothetical protein
MLTKRLAKLIEVTRLQIDNKSLRGISRGLRS